MNMLDDKRDEIRLSLPIVERLAGRFRFASAAGPALDEDEVVDIQATNEHVALADRKLDDFVAVSPRDPRVMQAEHLAADRGQIDPREIVLVLLCGGLSFRSGGEIHPLKIVENPNDGKGRALLDLQLDRVARSPLHSSRCILVGTPYNEQGLRFHLDGLPSVRRPHLCIGGLAPRLLPRQKRYGFPLPFREPSGEISYNPVGHLEALRWLILSGMLCNFVQSKVIVIASYSNWGQVFDSTMMEIAGFLSRVAITDRGLLFIAEVTQRDSEKRQGSMLVSEDNSLKDLRLVKFSYGAGKPQFPNGKRILMSTNTLYFSTSNLLERLRLNAAFVSIPSTTESVTQLLSTAGEFRQRDEVSRLFDTSFPV